MKKIYKFSRRFIGIILATVMLVAGFAGPDVKAAATQELIVSCNIGCEFDSSFSLVYYYKIESTGDFSDIYLKVAFQKYPEGSSQYTREVTEITDYTYDSITKQYRFVFSGISAPEMSNIAYATLCAKKGNQAYASSQTEYSV
ncbi:MAG: hypothetical protein IKW90_12860, partial [Lachnospiraceae bacterium]|nr:hypothetical protein [Lachnospiraceae bacterium]